MGQKKTKPQIPHEVSISNLYRRGCSPRGLEELTSCLETECFGKFLKRIPNLLLIHENPGCLNIPRERYGGFKTSEQSRRLSTIKLGITQHYLQGTKYNPFYSLCPQVWSKQFPRCSRFLTRTATRPSTASKHRSTGLLSNSARSLQTSSSIR